jgi:bifunctional non-homologous end joining protein LigD
MRSPTDPVFQVLSEDARRLLVPKREPGWIPPMLATLTDRRFSDPDWLFERKLDGERCLAYRRGDRISLMSRNRLDVSRQYPELVTALASQPCDDFVVDGEVVAFRDEQTSFARLQQRMHVNDPDEARRTGVPVFFYLFDVPYVAGHDAAALALRDRRLILQRALRFRDPLRISDQREEHGESFYREACSKGWEGLIAKRGDSPYESRRSRAWLKFKCVLEQEFVVGGFTEPQGSRSGLGALLIGYYEGEDLVYAGKVGTGFTHATLTELATTLGRLKRRTAPFTKGSLPSRGVHWVRPTLVAEIGFSEWTEDSQLRHPRYLGLRRDKAPKDVVRERPT